MTNRETLAPCYIYALETGTSRCFRLTSSPECDRIFSYEKAEALRKRTSAEKEEETMDKNKRKALITAAAIGVVAVVLIIAARTTTADSVQATFWGLVPPVVAISLALLTKEVYSSLFIGILTGALLLYRL